MTLSLTTQKTTPTHVERMISLQYRDQSLKRTVVHLQFTSWPELWVFSFWSCVVGIYYLIRRSRLSTSCCEESSFLHISPQGSSWQQKQPAAVHPGGSWTLPPPEALTHTCRGALQVSVCVSRCVKVSWVYVCPRQGRPKGGNLSEGTNNNHVCPKVLNFILNWNIVINEHFIYCSFSKMLPV